jgi:hypothetical protein
MTTKILSFDPIDEEAVQQAEQDLDALFKQGYEIITTAAYEMRLVLILTQARFIPVLPRIEQKREPQKENRWRMGFT